MTELKYPKSAKEFKELGVIGNSNISLYPNEIWIIEKNNDCIKYKFGLIHPEETYLYVGIQKERCSKIYKDKDYEPYILALDNIAYKTKIYLKDIKYFKTL